MAPTPQEHGTTPERPLDGERVVISGMSGLFPQANHVQQLSDNLYNKHNPVTNTSRRWKYNHPELVDYVGVVPQLDRFDAQFFKVHYWLSNSMDIMSRKILEQAYQAIYDAGVNPEQLSGKKVGVYVGSCFSETEKACFYVASSRTGFGIAGCNKAMFANRISYWLNAKGPSMAIDDACCSSFAALEQAYLAIARGECEAAIVGGGSLCLHPQSSVHTGRIMSLCADGKTKSFDQNADGVAKSEAINILFLQRAKNAKRIYAEVLHVKTEFNEILEGETGPKYGFYRDPVNMATFMKNFYDEACIPPHIVEYVEAFGSAVPEADKAELQALEEVFCQNRNAPLLVGSVMSNIGYGEAASGISAITKVLLGYHKGELAANLHFQTPRQDVKALQDGRMQIVAEHTKFGGAYTAVNGISVTGVNAHVLLHGQYKAKDPNRYKSAIPRLVTISGRQDTSVRKILDDLKSRPVDPEEHALLHSFHEAKTSGHLGRGYIILDTNEEQKTVSLAEKAEYFDDVKRPLWFVYSGMGSQWAGMGSQLMRIPIFAAAIERCRKVLEPKGVDIVNIITSKDKTIFDNILHSFVGIAAVQIGLTDVLNALGLVPDKIIGHSVGELGCAYADGCFTAEEMILAAYSRGLVSIQTPFIRGSMAAVGIGYEQVSKLVPPEIEVACHNGPESSTISGPADAMREFVAKLTEQGIFAREVPCSNIAYHSRYIAEAGPGLLKYLREVIKTPKLRSERWLSTSVPEEKWGEPLAKYSSAEYHTNNLLNSVLFEETSRLVPSNAVLVEIAPHGLLQAILKRSLPESCHHIPLTRRGHPDNVFMVLDAIGKLYIEGYCPKVHALYPQVQFPVSTGTPMLSHLVEWAHTERWNLPLYMSAHRKTAAASKFCISIHDKEHRYLQGHVIRATGGTKKIDITYTFIHPENFFFLMEESGTELALNLTKFAGNNLYPFAAALVAAWDTLAMSLQVPKKQLSVEFRDVHLYGQPALFDTRQLRLSVTLHRGTGRFEIMDENRKVATGFILGEVKDITRAFHLPLESDEELNLDSDDIYRIMYERDYFYRDEFKSIYRANSSLTEAQILWDNNWVTFLDGILQLNALRDSHKSVSQPCQIRRVCIDIKQHSNNTLTEIDGKTVIAAHVLQTQDLTRCGGVLLDNIKYRKLPILDEKPVVLKTLKFIPRFQAKVDIPAALQVYLQVVAENINKETINVLGVLNSSEDLAMFNEIKNMLGGVLGIEVRYEQMRREKVLLMRDYFLTEVDLVLVQNLSSDDSLCQMLYRVLRRDTFLINGEETVEDRIRPSALYRVVSTQHTDQQKLELIKWRPTQVAAASTVVTVRSRSDIRLLKGTRQELPQRHKLIILSPYPAAPGLKDLVKQWRMESDRNQIYLVMISDKDNLDQLPDLDLAYSVLNDGVWGGEYYTTWEEKVTVERGLSLRIARVGDLESFYWVETPECLGPDIPVTVHYASLNDIDAKRALGVISVKNDDMNSEITYCMDFSGVTDRGERVMGLVPSGAASGRVNVRPELLWPVPDHWTLEDAATVPLAYAHAFYCLDMKVRCRMRDSILVHGGAGALGQAVISVALAFGFEVFTTVSDIRKKHFLMKLFPELKEDHIGNSRDHSFGDMVNSITKGDGCNIVISCVKGDLKDTSIHCVAASGIILDTAQIPNQEDYAFGMFHLTRDRHYLPIDFSSIFEKQNIEAMQRLQVLISEGIARGYVRPLSRVTYSPQDVSRAFRLVASSRHRGRVVLRLRDPITATQPRLCCSPHLCQVVLCDEGAFGLQLADRLVSRGAKKLRLHCGVPSAYMRLKIQSWEKLNTGVKVQVSSEDLSSNKGVIELLKGSNTLGPVEGVYVIAATASDNTSDSLNSVVTNLDLAARKLCPSIRYFAVINADTIVGQHTCVSRARNGLPVTLINLPSLTKVDDSRNSKDQAMSWRSALNATERAIRSGQTALMAQLQTAPRSSLWEQISAVADIELSDEISKTATLLELGVDPAKVSVISSYLFDIHSVALSEEDIVNLTAEKIRELDEVIYGTNYEEIRGLGNFFTFVDPDELFATNDMVFLPTLTNNASAREDEFDVNQTHLCIVSGLEGHHNRFRLLCERLKLHALILQPGLDHLKETMRGTAERYAKLLMKKVGIKNNFYLLGYETGVIVALEMASILEEQGYTGKVFCVGGTPEECIATIEEQLSDFQTEEDLQNAVIEHMFTLMTGNSEGLDKIMRNLTSWRDKVDVCVRMLLGRVPHSAQYTRGLIEAAYTRIGLTRSYKPKLQPLRSKLILLHAASNQQISNSNCSTVEMLQRYSQQPVTVYELQRSLAHATHDLRCSNIINEHLDEDVLAAFEQRNLCETYLVNADTFMTSANLDSEVDVN